MSAAPDIYEAASRAVRKAVEAYERGDPGNREKLKLAGFEALQHRIEEAHQGNAGAVYDILSLARRILEAVEPVVLNGRDSAQRNELLKVLRALMRREPWLPVLYGPGGKTAGEQLVNLLQVGQELPLDYFGKWRLDTPMNRLCLRVLQIAECLLTQAEPSEAILALIYPKSTEEVRRQLVVLAGKRRKHGPLSEANLRVWVNQILVPLILVLDPDLEYFSEAKQVIRSKRVREHGVKPGNLRTELSKYLSAALRKLVRRGSEVTNGTAD